LRTCDSSLRTAAAICGAGIPVEDASRIITRCRFDWYFARLDIDFSRAPSSNESSRPNTSGGRITTSRLGDMHPCFDIGSEFPGQTFMDDPLATGQAVVITLGSIQKPRDYTDPPCT